MIVYMVGKTSG